MCQSRSREADGRKTGEATVKPAQDHVLYAQEADGAMVAFRWGDALMGARLVIADVTLGQSTTRPLPETGEFETRLPPGHDYQWQIENEAGTVVLGPYRFSVRPDHESDSPPGGRALWDLLLSELPLTFLDEDFARSDWVTTLWEDKFLRVSHALGDDEELLDERYGRVSVTGTWMVDGDRLRITKQISALDVEGDPTDDCDVGYSLTRTYPIAVIDGVLLIAGRQPKEHEWK